MSEKDKHPVTMAVRELRRHGVEFTHHPYRYAERPWAPETADRHSGYLVGLAPAELQRVLRPVLAEVANER